MTKTYRKGQFLTSGDYRLRDDDARLAKEFTVLAVSQHVALPGAFSANDADSDALFELV